MQSLALLSDTTLLSNTIELRKKEELLLHDLLVYFGEIDSRKLYRESAFSSMFSYLTEGLHYSEGAAYRRIQVARGIRRFPQLYEALSSGELSFSGAVEVSKCAEDDTIDSLILECSGKSRKEIELVVAKMKAPVPRKKERIKPVVVAPRDSGSELLDFDRALKSEEPVPTFAAKVSSETRYNIALQVDEEFMKLYEEAKALCGGNDMESSLKKLMREYIGRNSPEERQKRRELRRVRKEETSTASRESSQERSRHIPVEIQDRVALRDGGQCTYEGGGKRCSCKEHLEFDHETTPFGLGGGHEEENISLKCRAHNILAAEQVYGKEWMSQYQKY